MTGFAPQNEVASTLNERHMTYYMTNCTKTKENMLKDSIKPKHTPQLYSLQAFMLCYVKPLN